LWGKRWLSSFVAPAKKHVETKRLLRHAYRLTNQYSRRRGETQEAVLTGVDQGGIIGP